MGGAVSISPEYRQQNTSSLFELFNDKKNTKKMFDEIASYGQQQEGMRGKSDKIDLAELLLFITKEVNREFTDAFVKNTVVIKQAFNFSMGTKKGKSDEIGLKEFKRLVPALLLFSHLWHIFEQADDNVSDGRIFKPEFIRAKQQILDGKIEGVSMAEISDEDWAKEFDVINKSGAGGKGKGKNKKTEGDDFISFREFVTYTLKNIIKPAVYVSNVGESSKEKSDDDGGESGNSGENQPNAFDKMMSGLIDDMEENDRDEENQEAAVNELEKTEDESPEGEVTNDEVPVTSDISPSTQEENAEKQNDEQDTTALSSNNEGE